jgi:hypothetical protein
MGDHPKGARLQKVCPYEGAVRLFEPYQQVRQPDAASIA